ncbi:MOSC and FAD-binding oxidoreductase domain-containing protein [Dyella humicola]|uniref:MOSC and FAD-binding oxidoreductase domain-containing protein n=1 Tax=Dyella humicola TaxID=2992126 RepID=UPI00224D4C1F|nr:MOSC and FAD-binding oxidoreductase domain-containing protein [Dyella humicola]
MNVLLSVNVGRSQELSWQGKRIKSAIWKYPVIDRVLARRLNLAGDEQADLQGHGGEHRAVLVYQWEAYEYWSNFLDRHDLKPGNFGENLTVTGLADEDVWIGDRYQIGSALFEVTQPRVTCYKLGIRMEQKDLPSLMVDHRRPGFYMRVLREGDIGSGDTISLVERDRNSMSVAAIDTLLYKPGRKETDLERAIGIRALSDGWRGSFQTYLDEQNNNWSPALLWQGYRDLTVVRRDQVTEDVCAFTLVASEGDPLPMPVGGQHVAIRVKTSPDMPPSVRSYSLCGQRAGEFRIAIKRISGGVSEFLHEHLCVGGTLKVSSPRGSFLYRSTLRPVVLISAGIGITPLLGMLTQIASLNGDRPHLWWVHSARDGSHCPFLDETRALLASIPNSKRLMFFSRPSPSDVQDQRMEAVGRIDVPAMIALGVPVTEAVFYLCGPQGFMDELRTALLAQGVVYADIRTEAFGAEASLAPGVVPKPAVKPHLPADAAASGPEVAFSRSRLSVHWGTNYGSLLELAEACDVPVRWSCRTGVCHNCITPLLQGSVAYEPTPLELPPEGQVLLCCATPLGDVELDL